jgi:hypothetical protein
MQIMLSRRRFMAAARLAAVTGLAPRQRQGPAVVAVLLLHAGGQRCLCRETSGRYHPQIGRDLRRRAERVARLLVDGGRTERYDYALQSLRELPYSNCRDFDPRIRSGSSRCGCMKPGSSSRIPTRSSRTARTGGSSTRSSAS